MFGSGLQQLYRVDGVWVAEGPHGARIAQGIAVLLFAVLGWVALRRGGVARGAAAGVLLGGLACGLAGAWLADGLLTRDFEHFGLSLAGGVALGPAGGLLGAYTAGLRWRGALEALGWLSPAALVAAAVARVGCLFSGCDYGAASSAAWAVRHGWGSAAWQDAAARGTIDAWSRLSPPVHPFALYEAAGCVTAAAVVSLLLRCKMAPGLAALLAWAGYWCARALAAGFRGGPTAGSTLPFVLAGAVVGVALIAAAHRSPRLRVPLTLRPFRNCQEAAP